MAMPTSMCAALPNVAACSPEDPCRARREPSSSPDSSLSAARPSMRRGKRRGSSPAGASVKELIRAIETLKPEAVLMTGQAAQRAVVCVERFARNLDDAAAPDNLGHLRKAVAIAEGAPERLEAAAPVKAIAGAIREAGIPARVSRSAGGFVCNHLYFGALQYLRDEGWATPALFVHLPATPGQTPPAARARRLTAAEAATALKAAAAAMVDVRAKSA